MSWNSEFGVTESTEHYTLQIRASSCTCMRQNNFTHKTHAHDFCCILQLELHFWHVPTEQATQIQFVTSNTNTFMVN